MIEVLGTSLGPMHGLLVVVLGIAVVTDLSTMKIPNALTLPLWGIGVVWHVIGDLVGLSTHWAVGLVGLAVLFPVHFGLFALGIDKGGDAKLMIGVGACLGWWVGLEATVWAILLMGPVGMVTLVLMGQGKSLWKTLKWTFGMPVYRVLQLDPGPRPEPTYMPKAPVIAAAVVVAVLSPWLETWLLDDRLRAWIP
jgi:Flp pilus assembly protein protease CpaA